MLCDASVQVVMCVSLTSLILSHLPTYLYLPILQCCRYYRVPCCPLQVEVARYKKGQCALIFGSTRDASRPMENLCKRALQRRPPCFERIWMIKEWKGIELRRAFWSFFFVSRRGCGAEKGGGSVDVGSRLVCVVSWSVWEANRGETLILPRPIDGHGLGFRVGDLFALWEVEVEVEALGCLLLMSGSSVY
ncbi:hypothetical protein V8C26DRAFT_29723 [Trichoderma gracile]